MSSGKRNGHPRSTDKRKEDISEKVREIRLRQQNWMVQREQTKGKEVNNNKNNSNASQKTGSFSITSTKTSANSYKPTIQSYKPSNYSSEQKKKKVTDTFQHWKKSRENSNNNHDETASIGSDAESELERLVSPELESRNEPVAEEEFGSLADKIASRVKQNMGIIEYSPSDLSLDQSTGSGTISQVSRSKRCQTFVQSNPVFTHETSSNLASHNCSVCQKLMISSHHSPLMIIPCGHTLCKKCSEGRTSCPDCNCSIASLTVNIMLQQVIQEYHHQNHRLTSSTAHTSLEGDSNSSRSKTDEKRRVQTGSYRSQLMNLHTRQNVLTEEQNSLTGKLSKLNKQISHTSNQTQSIAKQEHEIKKAIVDLQDKLEALESHRQQYESQLTELYDDKSETEGKLTLLSGTLTSLSRELEKVQLLVEGEQGLD